LLYDCKTHRFPHNRPVPRVAPSVPSLQNRERLLSLVDRSLLPTWSLDPHVILLPRAYSNRVFWRPGRRRRSLVTAIGLLEIHKAQLSDLKPTITCNENISYDSLLERIQVSSLHSAHHSTSHTLTDRPPQGVDSGTTTSGAIVRVLYVGYAASSLAHANMHFTSSSFFDVARTGVQLLTHGP
jgi:hypothetical protein